MKDIYQEPWPAGLTSVSKNEFERLRNVLGKIECVVVMNLVNDPINTHTVVVGDKARLHLDGFALGYMGEGPHGFIWLLEQLDIPYSEREICGKQTEDTKVFAVPEEV